jgi:hypothetical protein
MSYARRKSARRTPSTSTGQVLAHYWYLLVAMPMATALAAGELAWFRATHPPLVHIAVVAALALVATSAFIVSLVWLHVKVRGPLRNLRYRWLTRDVDRRMKSARERCLRDPASAPHVHAPPRAKSR